MERIPRKPNIEEQKWNKFTVNGRNATVVGTMTTVVSNVTSAREGSS